MKGEAIRDPKGGLTARGRRFFKSNEGANLKPGVTNYSEASDADKKRWISWARRFAGQSEIPPLKKDNGDPTRFALMFKAWGEPVPTTVEAVKAVTAKAVSRAKALGMEEAVTDAEALVAFSEEAEEIEAWLDPVDDEPVVLADLYLVNSDVQLADDAVTTDEQPQLTWKVILRTGTWKRRPGPSGMKMKKDLKVFRDKAPKGHLSMASILKNFEAGAIQHVTVPLDTTDGDHHADKTFQNTGFVRKLKIEDLEDGSARLWAGIEFTEPDVKGKVERKTIPDVSCQVLFNYEETENGTKFDQVLQHVLLTHRPWLGGMPPFGTKAPEAIAAGETVVDEVLAFEASVDEDDAVALADDEVKKPKTGSVVWRADRGTHWIRGQIRRALQEWRDAARRQVGYGASLSEIAPYYTVEDVDAASAVALIRDGYGDEANYWVASYSIGKEGLSLDPVEKWVQAKQEWVAASIAARTADVALAEQQDAPPAQPAKPKTSVQAPPAPLNPLEAARKRRRLALAEGARRPSHQPTGGRVVGLVDEFLARGVELSETEIATMRAQEDAAAAREAEQAELARHREKERGERGDAAIAALSEKLGKERVTPGVERYIRGIYTSEDGEPALNLSEAGENGTRTEPRAVTASELMDGLIERLPKLEAENAALGEQASRVPNDTPPPKEPPAEGAYDNSPDAVAARVQSNFDELGLSDAWAYAGGGN